jgi:vacuolar protein sorting-associated protein 13A/C
MYRRCIAFKNLPGSSSSVTTYKCKHLIIDAGHIAIESNLAGKGAIREIQSKRNQRYSDEDYKHLESMMYDKLSLRLESAQVHLRNLFFFVTPY